MQATCFGDTDDTSVFQNIFKFVQIKLILQKIFFHRAQYTTEQIEKKRNY